MIILNDVREGGTGAEDPHAVFFLYLLYIYLWCILYCTCVKQINLKGVDSVDVPEINFKKGSLSLI